MDRIREMLIILGGRSKMAFTETVYVLDLETLAWTNIKIRAKADHTQSILRAEHSSAVSRFENKIYIFGGLDSDFKLANELQVLKFDDLYPILTKEDLVNFPSHKSYLRILSPTGY